MVFWWHAANAPIWVPTLVVLSALVGGNAVVARPSQRTRETSRLTIEALSEPWPADAVVIADMEWEEAEGLIVDPGVGAVIAADGEMGVTRPFTREVVARLRGILDEADQATASDDDANRRVAFLRIGLDYTDGYAEIFRLEHEWQEAGGGRLTPEMKERFRVALDRNWMTSRDIFDHDPLAVNVANVAWGSWAYFPRFGWKGPSEELLNSLK